MLIVRDDDGRVLPVWAIAHGVDELNEMVLAGDQIRVAGVFVVGADRLDERYGRKRSRLCGRDEVRFVFEMLRFRRGAVGVLCEIGEWLMMKLK